MSSFANASLSKESSPSVKNNSGPVGSNVGQSGGGVRGTEAGGVAIGEWPVRTNGISTNSPSNPTTLANRSSTGPRRPSLSTTLSHHPNHHNYNNTFVSSPVTPSVSSTSLNSTSNSTYHPPHHYTNQGTGGGSNGGGTGPRSYTRDEMLNIFKSMPTTALEKGLQEVLSKRSAEGETGGGGRDIMAEVCWVENGGVVGPISLEDMTVEEKELFSGNVNSPQKQMPQGQNNQNTGQHSRDHNHQGINSPAGNRKSTGAMGGNSSGPSANTSNTPMRSNQNQRRNQRDSVGHTHSPNSPAHHSDAQQPPPSITRRRTDLRAPLTDAFDHDKDKDPAPGERKEGPSRSNFGRWGSVATTNPSADDDHHDVPTPTSATVGRNMGLFRRGSSAWGASSVGAAGGLALGMGMGAAGGGAAAFNNGTFGGAAGFALSGGVPSSSASNSADKKIGLKTSSVKDEATGVSEKSTTSSIKSNSGEKETEGEQHADKQQPSVTGGGAESDRQQQLDVRDSKALREEEETDSFEPEMSQSQHRYQFYQDPSNTFDVQQRSRGDAGEHEDRPMSAETDPFGRRDSITDYIQANAFSGIKDQHLQSQSIAAAIGAEQTRLKATSPFSHASGAGSSVSTPTRSRNEMGFSGRDFGTAGALGSLHGQLRDLDLNQQGVSTHGQGSKLMGGEGSQSELSEHEPLSPTETNPYQSPAPEKEDDNLQGSGFHHEDSGFGGIGGIGGGFGGLGKKDGPSSDRSGRSSATGFGPGIGGGLGSMGLGNLGTTPGLWGTGGGGLPLGTPDRVAGASSGANNFFSTLGNEGPLLGGTSSSFGSMSRASKLGALFMGPEFQQEHQQHQHQQQQHHGLDSSLDNNDAFPSLGMGSQGGSMGVGSGRRLFAGIGSGLGGTESPMRERGDVHELFGLQPRQNENSLFGGLGGVGGGGDSHIGGLHGMHSSFSSQHSQPSLGRPTTQSGPAPGLPPVQSHTTTLVMPDKIQWEYRDPQGVIQGPFSGLEMHDWFKGGYFPQDLHVKRIEDPEFEPLSVLIRRIGNQREPFLVPLQGMAPVSQGGPSWGPASGWSDAAPGTAPGTIQPPFANSFPTFGTTLTAEQQNALERRKQEEQYLMARQREFLQQQQLAAKQAIQQPFNHLHQQPVLGAIQPPIGGGLLGLGGIGSFGSVGAVGPIGGAAGSIGAAAGNALQQGHHAFETGALLRQSGSVDGFGQSRLEDVLAQHSLSQSNMMGGVIQQPPIQNPTFAAAIGQQATPLPQSHPLQAQQAQQHFHLQQQAIIDRQRQQMVDRQQQQQQQPQQEMQEEQQMTIISSDNVQTEGENVRQHQQQVQQEDKKDEVPQQASQEQQTQLQQQQQQQPQVQQQQQPQPTPSVWSNQVSVSTKSPPPAASVAEASEQAVKKTATPKATSPASQPRKLIQSPWQAVQQSDNGLPAPFPPPPGASNKPTGEPLSINVSGVARTSPVETPHTSTSVSIAPWAQKIDESSASKGPSLKEIQEMEAKQAAALAEALAEQARKDALLQQSQAVAHTPPVPQVGLPSTATWASSTPASTPGSSGPVWGAGKPLAKSATLPIQSGHPKKTLQQIQKEEEAKKAKSAQQAAAAQAASALAALSSQTVTTPGGKRYAELAGKQPVGGTGLGANMASGGGAWTTVGAGGKIKSPSSNAPTPNPTTATPPALKSMPSTGVMGSFGKVAVVKQHPGLSSNTNTNTGTSTPSTPAAPPQPAKTPQQLAQEEFMKWCRSALKGLNSNVNQEEFLQSLLSFPPEAEIISDSIYANSSTMDGNRFAEEFIRRRKSAQQGVVVEAGTGNGSSGSGGGWNEVAAKAGRKESNGGVSLSGFGGSEPVGFKVVPGKKKGRK